MEFTRILRDKNNITIPIEVAKFYDIKEGDFIVLDLVKVLKK